MLGRIQALPFIVILMGIGALSMMVPGIHAAAIRDYAVMRAFIQPSVMFLILATLIGIATSGHKVRRPARNQLMALLMAFSLLPAMLAYPFMQAVQNTTFLNAYVEMVSSLTTTGATLFDPERLPDSVHLWRALVGWMGGFFIWLTAFAVLAPMHLGGFEVLNASGKRRALTPSAGDIQASDIYRRIRKFAVSLFPIYLGLTVVLWLALLLAGDPPLVGFTHAMSTLSTSGISPIGGIGDAPSGRMGEGLILVFLIFALSRQTFSADQPGVYVQRLWVDPEFRIGMFLVVAVPLLLFLRHFLGAFEVSETNNLDAGLSALWGGVFTVMSFLTTTGFESSAWDTSRSWSGLATPGILLMGLALVGGGVATTAGGVKLLRVFSLYAHGAREMDRLVHPSSVGGSGTVARRLRRQGAYVAWVFFMLFALSLAVVAIALSLTGLDFQASITLAIASLSTTGPLANVAADPPIVYGALDNVAKAILAAAMVLGRLETLAIIALLNPDFWRS